MARKSEEEKLLSPCRKWLNEFLKQKFPRAQITILDDTDRRQLRHALNDANLAAEFPESSAWEVRVDVVACIKQKQQVSLAFVELKAGAITLVNVGQLLGYCRVCRPIHAFLLSPAGPSSELERLLTTYGREDVLRYEKGTIRVGKWDANRNEPDWSTLIPPGELATMGPC